MDKALLLERMASATHLIERESGARLLRHRFPGYNMIYQTSRLQRPFDFFKKPPTVGL